jgi:DNA-3-methyladenine glycosylase II
VTAPPTQLATQWDTACTAISAADPLLGSVISAHGRECIAPPGDLFVTLLRAVVGQQLSVKAAATIWGRFEACVGRVDGSNILGVSVEALRAAGLSGRKVEYVRGLSAEQASLEQTDWAALDDAAVIARLVALRGVGPWTAEMLLIFHLQRPDVLPLTDIGVFRGAEKVYGGERWTAEKMERFAKRWKPWRSVATWYLWRSLDAVAVHY